MIHPDEIIRELATERQRQFDVRHQAEAAGKQIAFFNPCLLAIRESHAFDATIAFSAYGPHAATVRNAKRGEAQLSGLPGFSQAREKAEGKSRDAREGGLFADTDDVR